jgi:hypothetical protein
VHGPPSGPDVPALQTQSVIAVMTAIDPEFEFSGHEEHGSLPSSSLYFPTSHCTQDCPSGPVCPVLHLQFKMLELLALEVDCVGQLRHSDWSAAA